MSTSHQLITGTDFISIPTRDADAARAFYVETLGLRPDDRAEYEVWAGGTCYAIWAPESAGMPFRANEGGQYAFRVEDVAAARSALEAKGVQFDAPTVDTGVCHMAMFRDPDGNVLMLHHRHTPAG